MREIEIGAEEKADERVYLELADGGGVLIRDRARPPDNQQRIRARKPKQLRST